MIDPDFIELTTADFWEESHADGIVGIAVEWVSPSAISIKIQDGENLAGALLTAEQADALIRALAAARVEISKEPPK